MKIRDLMDHGTMACTTATTLDQAILTMRRLDRDALPVTSPDGWTTLGIVTEHDISLALALHPRPACELTVGEAMRQRAVMVAPDDDLRTLLGCMTQHHATRVPVVDANGHLEGTVGVEELLRRVAVSRRFGGEPSAKDVLETLRALCVPAREPTARASANGHAARGEGMAPGVNGHTNGSGVTASADPPAPIPLTPAPDRPAPHLVAS